MADTYGKIFNIQHFSTDDGDGIRTTVFFKGCNLRCPWCHNPEGLTAHSSLIFSKELCRSCGCCRSVCPEGARDGNGFSPDRLKCTLCGKCSEICPSGATSLVSKVLSVDEVMKEINEDYDFYSVSGGGVTLSGGEPLIQADFAAELLKACRRSDIPTLIETAGCVEFDRFEAVLDYTDSFFLDIKGASQSDYDTVGGNYSLAVTNLRKLIALKKNVSVRVPIVCGHSDGEDMHRELSTQLREIGISSIRLLPFHRLGNSKYSALSIECPCESTPVPSDATMKKLAAIYSDFGINAVV